MLLNDMKECQNSTVNFDFEQETMSLMLDFIYKGDIEITVHNVETLLETSDYMQVKFSKTKLIIQYVYYF